MQTEKKKRKKKTYDGLVLRNLAILLNVADDTRDSQRSAVDAGHEETLQHDLVERTVSTTSKEAVKLRRKRLVRKQENDCQKDRVEID